MFPETADLTPENRELCDRLLRQALPSEKIPELRAAFTRLLSGSSQEADCDVVEAMVEEIAGGILVWDQFVEENADLARSTQAQQSQAAQDIYQKAQTAKQERLRLHEEFQQTADPNPKRIDQYVSAMAQQTAQQILAEETLIVTNPEEEIFYDAKDTFDDPEMQRDIEGAVKAAILHLITQGNPTNEPLLDWTEIRQVLALKHSEGMVMQMIKSVAKNSFPGAPWLLAKAYLAREYARSLLLSPAQVPGGVIQPTNAIQIIAGAHARAAFKEKRGFGVFWTMYHTLITGNFAGFADLLRFSQYQGLMRDGPWGKTYGIPDSANRAFNFQAATFADAAEFDVVALEMMTALTDMMAHVLTFAWEQAANDANSAWVSFINMLGNLLEPLTQVGAKLTSADVTAILASMDPRGRAAAFNMIVSVLWLVGLGYNLGKLAVGTVRDLFDPQLSWWQWTKDLTRRIGEQFVPSEFIIKNPRRNRFAFTWYRTMAFVSKQATGMVVASALETMLLRDSDGISGGLPLAVFIGSVVAFCLNYYCLMQTKTAKQVLLETRLRQGGVHED